MTDFVIIIILALLLGGALWYMRKEKKKGVKCIGCPDAGNCAKRMAGESCQSIDVKNKFT